MYINHTDNSYPECIKISCNSIRKKLTQFFLKEILNDMNRIMKEYMQMSVNMKMCSTSLVIGKIQVENITEYLYTHPRRAKI